MINTITKTFEAKAKNVNRIECKVYYSKGGVNYFFGTNEQRGYYFSINPYQLVDHGNGLFSRSTIISPADGTTGEKMCILPVTRQTKKRYEQAKARIDDLIAKYLNEFCDRRGIELGAFLEVEESER